MDGGASECDAVFPFAERTALEPACVATARRFVDQTLTSWGVSEVAFDAQLVVSELVTNAIRHGGGAAQLRLLCHGPELACVVTDHSRTAPVAAAPDVFSEYGRGLRLVDALCSGWGWLSAGAARKLVWAVLAG
ncbi:ATP-binding protein [Actinomadura sp. ATCC 31491]|uniref:ATP-binding protein n=1 Tax=Actinomadura luzonensis TaxID=2805427 RepID=A0ABT0FYK6_9ACTN|nr:ATP-binding protein [Actinomadura luzonensis]MCK2217434.1 ATP-binding protein [Actinomadura luzonensis]